MWSLKPRVKVDSKSNKNKQSNKGGINVTTNAGNDASLAMIMSELLKINGRLNHIEIRSEKIHKAFNLYVQNNGVKPEIKQRVKDILDQ